MLVALLAVPVSLAVAQHSDAHSDGDSARIDAMFGTPDRYGTTPQDNIFATTPGLEQQARRSQFTINGLLPMFYNSTANRAPANGPAGINSAEFSPILGASWSTPVFDLPLRFTANARAEVDRFTQGWQPSVSPAQFDKIALSGRLQYIDPTNDQNFSPYFTYAPRFDFDPFFRERFATRQTSASASTRPIISTAASSAWRFRPTRWPTRCGRSASRPSPSGGSATPSPRRGPSF
jgi:hypothetical protein